MADEKERMEQQAPGQEEPVLSPEEENPPPQETQAEEPDPRDAELERLREENRELEERHLRLMVEFANFRNRTAKERESLYSDAVANTLKELLPVLDNFQRAMESPCADEAYQKGVELIYRGLWEMMTGMGVEEIAEAGVPFDPELHNAIMHTEDPELGESVLSQVFQRGFKLGDRVIRFAMVQVAN